MNGASTNKQCASARWIALAKCWRSSRRGSVQGGVKNRDKIIKAAEKVLGKNHGQRYYAYELNTDGEFEFSECRSLEHEKRIEGKYVIATTEKSLRVREAVAIYMDLADVERGFRHLKDVLAMRPIYHQVEPRVRAHIFVAALALLVQRLLDRRLQDASVEFSSTRAMEALSTVRHVTFRVEGQSNRCGVAGGFTRRPAHTQGPEGRRSPAADTGH